MRRFTVVLLLFPLLAQASSWTQKTAGAIISRGRQPVSGVMLKPPAGVPAKAVATRVTWHITPLSPSGRLDIALCSAGRCIPLYALSGQSQLPPGFRASAPFTFFYRFPQSGPITSPLNIVSQQLTVSWR